MILWFDESVFFPPPLCQHRLGGHSFQLQVSARFHEANPCREPFGSQQVPWEFDRDRTEIVVVTALRRGASTICLHPYFGGCGPCKCLDIAIIYVCFWEPRIRGWAWWVSGVFRRIATCQVGKNDECTSPHDNSAFSVAWKASVPRLWINGTNDIAFLANKGNILCATSMGLTLGPGWSGWTWWLVGDGPQPLNGSFFGQFDVNFKTFFFKRNPNLETQVLFEFLFWCYQQYH